MAALIRSHRQVERIELLGLPRRQLCELVRFLLTFLLGGAILRDRVRRI